MSVLITGFEPFGGYAVNPSWEAARALDGHTCADGRTRVRALQLPCVFGTARQQLQTAITALKPSVVICTGLAASRHAVSLEKVAINWDDARIPDNLGQQPIDQPVHTGGPAAFFTTLPIKAIMAALQSEGLAAAVSYTAGTYVCNHVFYALMHDAQDMDGVAGFIHLPDVGASMPGRADPWRLQDLIQALQLAIEVTLAHLEQGHATPQFSAGLVD